jgi:hypothetical protein
LIGLNRTEVGREVQNSPNNFRRSGENFNDPLKYTARPAGLEATLTKSYGCFSVDVTFVLKIV